MFIPDPGSRIKEGTGSLILTPKISKPLFRNNDISIRVAECGADYSYNDDDVVIVLDSEEENEYIQASSQHVIFSVKHIEEGRAEKSSVKIWLFSFCVPARSFCRYHSKFSCWNTFPKNRRNKDISS
jgi:hypothetical protein